MQAYVKDAGGIPSVYPCVSDDYDEIKNVYAQASRECDLVVSTGGACLGDFDLTPQVVRELGEILFERVNIKPGKSQPFAKIGNTPVFILSGNPGASSVGFEIYVRLAMRVMQGYKNVEKPVLRARVTKDINKKDPRMFLQRGRVSVDLGNETREGVPEDGAQEGAHDGEHSSAHGNNVSFKVEMASNQSSALFGALSVANCLAIIPAGTEGVRAGDYVDCIMLFDEDACKLAVN